MKLIFSLLKLASLILLCLFKILNHNRLICLKTKLAQNKSDHFLKFLILQLVAINLICLLKRKIMHLKFHSNLQYKLFLKVDLQVIFLNLNLHKLFQYLLKKLQEPKHPRHRKIHVLELRQVDHQFKVYLKG